MRYSLNWRIRTVLGAVGMLAAGASLTMANGPWEVTSLEDGVMFGWHTDEIALPSGEPAIAYYDAVNHEILFAWHGPGGWDTATIAGGVVHDCWNNFSLALLPSGQPAVSYGTEADWRLRFMWHAGDDFRTGWSAVVVDTDPNAGRSTCLGVFPPDHPDPAVRGQPAIASFTEGVQDLMFIWHTGADFADPGTWQKHPVDTDGMVGWNPSLTFFPADHPDVTLRGQPAISYFQWIGVDILKFAWHTGADLTANWEMTTVDQDWSYWVGTVSSVAVLPSGQPAIAYCDRTHGYLKYAAHVENFDFTANWQAALVDAAAGAPCENARPRLAILPAERGRTWNFDGTRVDLAGQPVIAYAGNWDLRFAWLDKQELWHYVTVDRPSAVVGQIGLTIPTTGAFDGEPAISYFDWNNWSLAPNDLRFARHMGFGWDVGTIVDQSWGMGFCNEVVTQTEGPNAGQPIVCYEMGYPSGGIMLAERRPDGVWQKSRISDCGVDPRLIVLPGGQLAVAYDCSGPTYAWRDAAGGWHSVRLENGSYYRSAALRCDGRPAFSYDHSDDLKYAECTAGDCTHVEDWQETVVDGPGDVGAWTRLAFFPPDHPAFPCQPAISFYDATNQRLKFAWRASDGATWHTCTADLEGPVGEGTGLVIFPMSDALHAGQPAISYYDAGNADLKFVWHDTDYDFSQGWHIVRIDTADVGSYTSMTLLPSGQPAVSYHAWLDGWGARYTWHEGHDLSDPNSWHRAVVDAGADAVWTNVAILGNGQPVISFCDEGGWEINVALAVPGDLNCDGVVDFGDINPFVLALTSLPPLYAEYYSAFPNCPHHLADCNGDGRVDFGDINPFVALLTAN